MGFTFGITETEIARQVAGLINNHNRLAQLRQGPDILHSSITYVLEVQGRVVLGVCGVDKQSYTFTEIKHLVVHPKFRKRGIAKFMISRALAMSATPLVFASVRKDNQSSLNLFSSLGFKPSIEYPSKDHQVVILTKANPQWQKKSSGPTWSLEMTQPPLLSGGVGLPSE